ncbi:hypothetical protein ACFX2F_007191 [Malus domestica]
MTKAVQQRRWLCNGFAVAVKCSENAVAVQLAVKLLCSCGVQRNRQTCANMKQQASGQIDRTTLDRLKFSSRWEWNKDQQSSVKAGKALNAHIYLPASSIFGEKTKTYSFSLASYPNPDDKIKTTRFKDQAGEKKTGNALTCVARRRLSPKLISKVSDDTQGRAMLHELQTDSIGTSLLRHGHEEHLFEKVPTTLDEREARGRADDVAVA